MTEVNKNGKDAPDLMEHKNEMHTRSEETERAKEDSTEQEEINRLNAKIRKIKKEKETEDLKARFLKAAKEAHGVDLPESLFDRLFYSEMDNYIKNVDVNSIYLDTPEKVFLKDFDNLYNELLEYAAKVEAENDYSTMQTEIQMAYLTYQDKLKDKARRDIKKDNRQAVEQGDVWKKPKIHKPRFLKRYIGAEELI